MSDPIKGEPLVAVEARPRARQTFYPEPLASLTAGRVRRPLGDPFGLTNFGVNHTRLAPGACTALRHAHSRQDEFVYVLEGRPMLITGHGPRELVPGMCIGFKAGDGNAHHLANRSDADVVLLEVGDRTAGDEVEYPDDDIRIATDPDGSWMFVHKDGTPFER